MNETPDTRKTPDTRQPETEKRPYTPPELTEHGSAQDVTLQTFFGSFSP